jgi:aspartate/methionine/tyrosine aminotransferase
LFPKFEFPAKAKAAAQSLNRPVDVFYALQLLENTGVCMVPGSGFGQKPDTFHVRSTFLPPEEELDEFIGRIKDFHIEFIQKFKD